MSAERPHTITRHSLRDWLRPSGAEDAEETEMPEPTFTGGAGDLVKIILDKLGIKLTRNCGCEAMRRRINEWGYAGCWTHRKELADWFMTKATEAGVKLNAGDVLRLLTRATGKHTLRDNDSKSGA